MANYFVNLPAAQVPRNALLDLEPVNNALESYRQQSNLNRQRSDMLEERTYQRGRDATQDARVAKNDARADVEWYGKASAAVDRLQGQQRVAAWQRVLQRHGGQGLTREEMDPVTGPKLLMAEAGQWRDPRDDQMKDLELQKTQTGIDLNRANIAAASRRADNVVEVDGRLVRVEPGGGATEIYSTPTAGNSKAPSGFEWDPAKPGALRPIPGGPGEFRSFTETQTKDAGFGARMLRSEDSLDSVMSNYDPTRARNAYFPDQSGLSNLYTANLINSKEWQRYIQASRESMAALLRKDTGAAISDQEFELYFPMYYPQPGDSPEVVQQKKAAREEIARGLAAGSGGAFEKSYPDRARILGGGQQGAQGQAPTQTQTQTKIINGKTYINVDGQWFEQ